MKDNSDRKKFFSVLKEKFLKMSSIKKDLDFTRVSLA